MHVHIYKAGIGVTGRRGRKRRKLLDDLKGTDRILSFEGGSSKVALCGELALEEALDRS